MISEIIKKQLISALEELSITNPEVKLEHPDDFKNGDYSTNAALSYAKALGLKPRELGEKLAAAVKNALPDEVEKIEVAGPGFINFYLSRKFFADEIEKIRVNNEFGRMKAKVSGEVLVEYTDPNAFKPFHIGHLMSNAIGESVSRLAEYAGANVKRICYPSDIGLHIAKAVWAITKNLEMMPKESAGLIEKTAFLGKAYIDGTAAYESDEAAKKEIEEINRKLFEKSDKKLNEIYETGRRWSYEHFDEIYKKVGTKFDLFISESEVAGKGEEIVKEFLAKGVFEKSEGAVVFSGEKYGLHTRVFINSKGLPTYETKELGLNFKKAELFPQMAESLIVTASEQNDYFKVLIKVMELVRPELGRKTKHLGHGMLRFAEGKMSSRKGNVITAETLIAQVEDLVKDKIKDRNYDEKLKAEIVSCVSIGALKYSILKQAIGGDIIYDFEKSISFEGDSGPYLQYACARARSVLQKAAEEGLKPDAKLTPAKVFDFERLLVRFPEVIARANSESAPNQIVTYLIGIASSFNSFYAVEKIADGADRFSPYKLGLTQAFFTVMKNGLWVLGIEVPSKM